jgi:hypothetical protein
MGSFYCDECCRIEENSTYSAETHHILAKRQRLWYKTFQLIPAIATAVIGTITVGQVVPRWIGVCGLISAVVTAIATGLNPQQAYYDHVNAAKAFTVAKHDARYLRELAEGYPTEELPVLVKNLHDRYNDLVRVAPVTEDWAFERARKRIQSGAHTPDEKI